MNTNSIKYFFQDLIPYYIPHWLEEGQIWLKRQWDKIKRNKYCQIGFILFVLSFLCFATTYFTNMFTVPMGGDYVLQMIPFAYNAYDDWHYFFQTGVFPLWDTSGFLGVNNIGAYSFYNLTSPWTLIYLIFPRNWISQIQGILQMVKITTAGLLFYCYLGSFKMQESTKRIGAIAFAFCGYVFYNLWFHFLDVVCFFPLLLWGIERVLSKKGNIVLIISICLLGFTNYFFMICFLISSIVYVFFRVIQTWKTRSGNETLRIFAEGVLGYLAGVMITAVVWIPSLKVGLNISSIRNGSNYFKQLLDAKDSLSLLKLLFVFPTSYEAAYPLSSFFFMNFNCFSSNLYRPRWYNNTMSSIFVFTPLMLMLVPSILDSIRTKKWSHLVGCFGTMLMLFTPFAYYVFFGGSALYGRWEVMASCWMIVFFLIHFENRKEMPKYYLDISIVFSITMMIITYFLADNIQKNNTNTFYDPDGRNWVVIYQIIYSLICYVIMRTMFKKQQLPNIVLALVALEAVIQGNATIVGQGVQRYQDLAGGINNLSQEREIVSALNNYDTTFFRIFDSTVDRGANNYQMNIGYNGISTFNTNYATDLRDMLRWSRINYNDSWSMSVNEKRYNLDSILGIKYYLLKADDVNIPYGFVDVSTLDANGDEELKNLQNVLEKNKTNHKLYLNTRYIDTFFTYDTLISSSAMSTSYVNENKNETVYLKYGIINSDDLKTLKSEDAKTFNHLSGENNTLNNSSSYYSKATRTLSNASYNLEVRIPDWSSDGSHILGTENGSYNEVSEIESDMIYTRWNDLDKSHSKTPIDEDGNEYVINGYLPYWTRIVMNFNTPVCSGANRDDKDSGCYVSVNAKFGFNLKFFLIDEDDQIINYDHHYVNTYDGSYDWKYARGFYTDRPVKKIVGFVMGDIRGNNTTSLTNMFPQPSVQYSYYSQYIEDTDKQLEENKHYNITYRDANTLKFTTDFTEDKLHYTVLNIPYDNGWTLTRSYTEGGKATSENVKMYRSQGGLIGFESINSNEENQFINYTLSYSPEGLSQGAKYTIIGLLIFLGMSYIYMAMHINDKFYKYSYMNIKTHWYDKEIWEKEKKIKRRYNVNPNSRKRKR